MVARRLSLAGFACVCALAGVFVFAGVSAQAAVIHEYLPEASQALTEGVPASSGAPVTGPVGALGPMTVDSGHLWIAEYHGLFRVDEFDDVTGGFVSQLPQVPGFYEVGLGVAVGHGTVYVGAAGVPGGESGLAVFSEAGVLQATWTGASTPPGSFGSTPSLFDVAVDRSAAGLARGSVYVVDERQHVVDVFGPEVAGEPPVSEPSAEHVRVLEGTCPVEGTSCAPLEVIPFQSLKHVAVDNSTGNVLVQDHIEEEVAGEVVGRDVVDVFEPGALGYVFVRQIKLPLGENPQSIGVDGGNGDIYVAAFEGRVDQFSSTGVFLGRITGENTPRGDLSSPQSVAVDPESHHVFVGDYRNNRQQPSVVDVFGPDIVIPDVATSPATNVTRNSAVLNGTVKLNKEGGASCQFVWGTSQGFGQTAPCSGPVTQEESAVQATLSKATGSELEPDTTYYYRLQATNKNGLNPGEPSQDRQFTTPGPGIHEEAVSNVAATSVTLTARINPHGAPATAYFQYGTSSAYGTNVPAAPGLPVGSGEGDVEVAPQHAQGLSGGTVYHYRVVAVSELSPGVFEEFDGPDQTFTTQQSGGVFELLDGRSWELVTPPEKKGALLRPIREGIIQASSNGDAIADLASQPTEAEPLGYPTTGGVSVLSTRGSASWSSQVISPPTDAGVGVHVGVGAEYRFFSEDLSLGIVQPFGQFTPLSPEASEPTAYLRTDYSNGDVGAHCQSSCFRPLVTAANTPAGTAFGEEPNGKCESTYCGARFVDATPDLSHIVLQVEGLGAVEWAGGKLTSTGGVSPENGTVGTRSPIESGVGHAISNDGSRIVGGLEGGQGLYLHDMVTGETVQLDLGVGAGVYMGASSDDSRIFFLAGGDLYEYDLNAPLGARVTDLTVDQHANEVANVQQVMGISEDGSYVYFVAEGALAPGGTTGSFNLYVRHAGVTRLVAVLSAEDTVPWKLGNSAATPVTHMSVRVSPNGRWLTFMSNRDLTGYNSRDAVSGHPDEEVYLYDANGDKLVCASCNPSGARPVGVEVGNGNQLVQLLGPSEVAANVPPWTTMRVGTALYQSRYLSDTGRLFFNSNDSLVSHDVNGTEDVYEYEPVGVGDCGTGSVTFGERSGGCVGLVSSGASSEESAFLDASASGGDVFFLTASKLVSQDFDTALDVYDAHECVSREPCYAAGPVAPPACSTGDSCKAAPSPQPLLFGSPSSATFSGAGNVSSSGSAPVLKSRPLTRGQKLAQALRVCRRKHGRAQRTVCERKARSRFGAGKQSRKANATKKSGR
jgi:hypothetical protein